jgi:hypothetical protein
MILILQQHEGQGTTGKPREGYGMVMINKPFMGNATMTFCVDDILERVVEVSMKGLYRKLRQMGIVLGAESMRETLTAMCDAQLMAELDKEFQDELPQVGNFTDFGRAIEYGKKTKAKQRRTPDGEAQRQLRIKFYDCDKETADEEAKRNDND